MIGRVERATLATIDYRGRFEISIAATFSQLRNDYGAPTRSLGPVLPEFQLVEGESRTQIIIVPVVLIEFCVFVATGCREAVATERNTSRKRAIESAGRGVARLPRLKIRVAA